MSEERTTKTLCVVGCDDTTYLALTLTAVEWDLVERIARECTERGGGCRPTMRIEDDPRYPYE